MSARRALLRSVGVAVAIVLALACWIAWSVAHVAAVQTPPALPVAAGRVLLQPIADDVPNAAQLRRGQYLVRLGDCLSCHTAPDGQPFAGGLGLNTPFGVIYSSNITPDKNVGIGSWTKDQFYAAMHDGIRADGQHLYPAFPYPWFRRVGREDDDAIFAYLQTLPASNAQPPSNALPFPFNQRRLLAVWNTLFLDRNANAPDSQQSAEWKRGADIVQGLGHCSGCHTPKNAFGADRKSQDFHGAVVDNHVAPDLTGNLRTGLGSWSVEDVAQYLKDGRNARESAGGPMADVITFSMAMLSDEDRHAVATYLKALPASADENSTAPDAAAMQRGAAIFSDACSSCHLSDGRGQPGYFPPLGHNAVVQQNDPSGVLHIVLAGSRVGPGTKIVSPMTMPSFAWKLSDREIADVLTFLRNSWGNRAPAVAADAARKIRDKLDLNMPHLTDNSGDQANAASESPQRAR